jgi:fatty-acyl-CoA synthase
MLSDIVIKTLADVEQIEQTPLGEQGLANNTYEAIHRSAEKHGDQAAIIYIENGDRWKAALDDGEDIAESVSYNGLLAQVTQAANLFRSLGITSDEVVSIVMPNLPEHYYVLFGAETAGIANPINYLLEAAEIGEIAHSANSKVLVIMGQHEEFDIIDKLPEILRHASGIETVLVVGSLPEPDSHSICKSYANAVADQNADHLDFDNIAQPTDIASLFHTGGTTGVPKLAQHTYQNELYTAWAINQVLRFQEGDRSLVGLPIFHCNAAIASGLSGIMNGAAIVLAGIGGYRSPGIISNFYQILEHFKVVGFSAVPTIYAALLQLPSEDYDFSALRIAGCGAAPMPVELFKNFQEKTGLRISEGYGLTEATVCSTIDPPASDYSRIGSIGMRIPYTKVKAIAIDADGRYLRDCEVDEVGVIVINAPSVTPGYTDESKNADLFVEHDGERWLNTGDLGRQDADGYFWLTGRAKELIIRGGHNIDPKSIEEVLATHPAVKLAAAIGRPDAYAGEVPVAYVELSGDANELELLDYCKQHIGERAAIPKAVTILDSMPVTGVGKIHKPSLHLMELESTAASELASFSGRVNVLKIEAYADKKLGNAVDIVLSCKAGESEQDVEQELRKSLGAFSFAYSLSID